MKHCVHGGGIDIDDDGDADGADNDDDGGESCDRVTLSQFGPLTCIRLKMEKKRICTVFRKQYLRAHSMRYFVSIISTRVCHKQW